MAKPSYGTDMTRPVADREHAMALQRLEEADERIDNLERRIRELKGTGEPTIEAEHLLELMRRSRASMKLQADLLAADRT
jgi:hypothetical protein